MTKRIELKERLEKAIIGKSKSGESQEAGYDARFNSYKIGQKVARRLGKSEKFGNACVRQTELGIYN